MSIFTNILTGGSNNHETTSENANGLQTDFISEGVVGAITNTSGVAPATGALAVNAQGTPDMTVAVSSGRAYVIATPSGQASQCLSVYNNASANVTIAANSSGSTKFDWIYLSVSAANAASPNAAGDNVTTLVASRSSSASSDDGTPPTYGYLLAVVTVANGASSIANGSIADKRFHASFVNAAVASPANTISFANAAAGSPPIIEAVGTDANIHLVARAKGNGLTKVSVLRQDNTTNSYKHNSVLLTGYGVGVPGVAAFLSETVNLGVTFAQAPVVVLTFGGDDTGASTTYGAGAVDDAAATTWAHSPTTTTFVARVQRTSGNWASGTTVFYQWIAIGELA